MIVMGSEWVSISDNCAAIFGLAPRLQISPRAPSSFKDPSKLPGRPLIILLYAVATSRTVKFRSDGS